ncbi:acyltransferase [Heliobacterium chlorum]|uniref:Acyltransferase n=1 Tax=Heliobacterium chlorum TaxID=2698 RepID=A0ABR7T792_HELCL|nr:acyltransferase [Heliobacterium chlorum]MBC9786496.1 acyltransferase [Heliobacterium chlorum]
MRPFRERLYFIDNLRVFVIFFVILLHTAMSYMVYAPEWWYVVDEQRNLFFDLFVLLTDVFIMPIMFFSAGYFVLPTLIGKGPLHFWLDKVRRILLPWIFGVLFLAPFISYMIVFSRSDTPPDYLSFWFGPFWGPYFQHAHYWFLGVLSLFFLLLTLTYLVIPGSFEKGGRTYPSPLLFIVFLILTTGAFFVGNLFYHADAWVNVHYLFLLQPTRIGIYVCYFLLGVYSWRRWWFTSSGYQPSPLGWSVAAVVSGIVFLGYRLSFTNATDILPKAGLGFLHAAFCMTMFFACSALFQQFVNSDAFLWRRLAANSYGIYYFHMPVLLPLVYLMKPVAIPIGLKFGLLSVTTFLICFVSLECVHKIRQLFPSQKQRLYSSVR